MAVVDILTIRQSPQMGKGPGSLELLYTGRERLVYISRKGANSRGKGKASANSFDLHTFSQAKTVFLHCLHDQLIFNLF